MILPRTIQPALAMLAVAAIAVHPARGQEVAGTPTVQLRVTTASDTSVIPTNFGGNGGATPTPQSFPSPQYPPPVEKQTMTPQMATPALPQAAQPSMAFPQSVPMMMVPQMSSTSASMVQVPAQNVIIQQPELRFFVAQSAPSQPMNAQPMTMGNIFLPQPNSPTMNYAALPMAAPSMPMAAMPMAAPTANAVPTATTGMPLAGGTITNQAISLASGESSSRFEIEAPSRFRNRLANALESASGRVRGQVRMRSVQETRVRSPQSQTGAGGPLLISNSFTTPGMAQNTTQFSAQPQAAPPSSPPVCEHPPALPPSKMPPVLQKTPPIPHKH